MKFKIVNITGNIHQRKDDKSEFELFATQLIIDAKS